MKFPDKSLRNNKFLGSGQQVPLKKKNKRKTLIKKRYSDLCAMKSDRVYALSKVPIGPKQATSGPKRPQCILQQKQTNQRKHSTPFETGNPSIENSLFIIDFAYPGMSRRREIPGWQSPALNTQEPHSANTVWGAIKFQV